MSDTARAYTLADMLYKSITDTPYIPTDFWVLVSPGAADGASFRRCVCRYRKILSPVQGGPYRHSGTAER